jgi:hypothetical protein
MGITFTKTEEAVYQNTEWYRQKQTKVRPLKNGYYIPFEVTVSTATYNGDSN